MTARSFNVNMNMTSTHKVDTNGADVALSVRIILQPASK